MSGHGVQLIYHEVQERNFILGHRNLTVFALLLAVALVAPEAGGGALRDCHLADAARVLRDSDAFVHRARREGQVRYFGCLGSVGRQRRLAVDSAALRASKGAVLTADGGWLGFAAVARGGKARVQALDLRSGRRHGAPAVGGAGRGRVVALVVNWDGSLAWIGERAGRREVWLRGARAPRSRLVHVSAAIGTSLSLEDSRCVFTWRLAGEQRGTSLPCANP